MWYTILNIRRDMEINMISRCLKQDYNMLRRQQKTIEQEF